jgi:hypothetical protein
MSTLKHKHGCNQEFYNMHVLSHCKNKQKVACQKTPQRQISVSVNLFYNICQATHNTRKKARNYRISSKARRGFSLKFGTHIGGNCKYVYDTLNRTVPNWIALNQIMRSQTMPCFNKLWDSSIFLRYPAALSGNSLQVFWYNLSVPPSRVKNSKRSRACQKLTDAISLWIFVHCLIF